MPNIAVILKSEIARIARKELRAETERLKKALTQQRSEIAALKRRLVDLERDAAKSSRRRASPERLADAGAGEAKLRFRPAGLAAHRKRLGLSANDFGKLLGVSGLTVYKWEKEQARPRRTNLSGIAAVRAMGVREARARLEQLA